MIQKSPPICHGDLLSADGGPDAIFFEGGVVRHIGGDLELGQDVFSHLELLVEALILDVDGDRPVAQNRRLRQGQLARYHALGGNHLAPFLHAVVLPILDDKFFMLNFS